MARREFIALIGGAALVTDNQAATQAGWPSNIVRALPRIRSMVVRSCSLAHRASVSSKRLSNSFRFRAGAGFA
jgi:hypothetical protein